MFYARKFLHKLTLYIQKAGRFSIFPNCIAGLTSVVSLISRHLGDRIAGNISWILKDSSTCTDPGNIRTRVTSNITIEGHLTSFAHRVRNSCHILDGWFVCVERRHNLTFLFS